MDNRFKIKERIQERVTAQDRFEKVHDEVRSIHSATANAMIRYFSYLMEQAYIAGANRVNISKGIREPLTDTGEILVDARAFVKDKGMGV